MTSTPPRRSPARSSTCSASAASSPTAGRSCRASTWPTIDRVRELAPELSTGWLLGLIENPHELIGQAADGGHVAVHPHHAFVNEDLVRIAHDAGLAVNTWTCDEPERIRWLADLGVDAVITNAPDIALAALGR